jgi:hypothetical protein
MVIWSVQIVTFRDILFELCEKNSDNFEFYRQIQDFRKSFSVMTLQALNRWSLLAKLDFRPYFSRTLVVMKRVINITFSFFGLLLLSQCKNADRKRLSWNMPIPKVRSGTNSLFGTWAGDCCMFYSSVLKLEADSTFTFYDRGCTQQRFTQGRWKIRNGTIVLSSNDIFKPKVQDWPFGTVLVPKGKRKHRRLKEGMVELTGIKDTLIVASFGSGDTTRIYFDRLQLMVRRDTLYGINSNNFLESAKFYLMF